MINFILGWALGILLIIGGWWLASFFITDNAILPSPFATLGVITNEFFSLLMMMFRTAKYAAIGLLFAVIVSLVLVLIAGAYPKTEVLIYPYIVMLKATPSVAFAPLLVVLIGSGAWVKIIVAALIAFFPTVIGGLDGMKRTPKHLLMFSKTYGGSRWAEFNHINIGFVISGFFSGLKTSAPLAVVGAIVGEFVDASAAGEAGIGVYIASHARSLYMDQVFAGATLATILGLLFFSVVAAMGNVVDRRLRLER